MSVELTHKDYFVKTLSAPTSAFLDAASYIYKQEIERIYPYQIPKVQAIFPEQKLEHHIEELKVMLEIANRSYVTQRVRVIRGDKPTPIMQLQKRVQQCQDIMLKEDVGQTLKDLKQIFQFEEKGADIVQEIRAV